MGKKDYTIRQAPGGQEGYGRSDFDPTGFDILVYQKGKEVVWESAVKCPCKSDGRGHLTTCVNCGGTGWVFINPVKTRMVVQSMNLSSKYGNWALERIGMANITTRYVDIVSDMDRITLTDSVSKFSQIVRPTISHNKLFAFLNYNVISILDVFLFKNDGSPLKLLSSSQYSHDGNKIIITDKKLYTEGMTVSVRYTHNIQYFIIDIIREMRESSVKNESNKETITKLPLSAVGRRCHYVLNPDNFDTSSVVSNSYQKLPDKTYNVTD